MSVREEMTDLVVKLRAEKRKIHATATTVPFTREFADALGPILQNPMGQLAEELNSMWDLVKSSPNPAKAIFVPKPSTSNTKWAAISWLQILVVIAQAFSSDPRRIPPRDHRLKLGNLKQVITAARHAWDNYVKLHGARTVVEEVIEAVGYLLATLPRGLALDGRGIVRDGFRIDRKLTRNEHVFLKLLIDKNGKIVSLKEFQVHGILNPAVLKHRLVGKAGFELLHDYIVPDSGGYRLRLT